MRSRPPSMTTAGLRLPAPRRQRPDDPARRVLTPASADHMVEQNEHRSYAGNHGRQPEASSKTLREISSGQCGQEELAPRCVRENEACGSVSIARDGYELPSGFAEHVE